MNTFLKRANDEYWKSVSCIQTNVKSKIGCGMPIIIKFYAPIDYNDPEAEIVYDYKSLGADNEIVKKDEHLYCLKQCYKMCYYISKIYHFEILKMRCEFSKDENGTVRVNMLMYLDMVLLCLSDQSKVNQRQRKWV